MTFEELKAEAKRQGYNLNNRRYDNHMLYARMMGYSNQAKIDAEYEARDAWNKMIEESIYETN